jgi:hypothetical protein
MIPTNLLVIVLALFGSVRSAQKVATLWQTDQTLQAFAAPVNSAIKTCHSAAMTVDKDVRKTCSSITGFSAAQLGSDACKLASSNAVTAVLASCIPAAGATTAPGVLPKASDFGKSAAAFTAGTKGGDALCVSSTDRAAAAIKLGCSGKSLTMALPNANGIANCNDGMAQAIAIALNGACGNAAPPKGSSGAAIASAALAQEAQATQLAAKAAASSRSAAAASATSATRKGM